ncbi:MAG: glycosyltransferase family 87 protein [Planctomycetota bacterium]
MSSTPSESDGPRLSNAAVAALLVAVAATRVLAFGACSIYDDAFITYRYALNFAQGDGLVFNPGAAWEPVLGTTTPAYALLLGYLAHWSQDVSMVSRMVNVACDVASAGALILMFDRRVRPATLSVLGYACLPQLLRISDGGMESPLFGFLALAASLCTLRGRPLSAGVLAAACCTVRPEGVLLLVALAFEMRRSWRDLVRFAIPVGVIGIASLAAIHSAYGDVIPQSVRAKSAMPPPAGGGVFVKRWLEILGQAFLPHVLYLPLVPLVAWGLVRTLARQSPLRAFSLFALAITASYLVARPHLWGWYFFVPLVAWSAWLAEGIDAALAVVERWRGRALVAPRLLRAAPIVLAFCAAAGVGVAAWVRPSPVPTNVYGPLQSWARETSTREPHARILASDIGAIGYAWKGVVLDSEGLTWPAALAYRLPNRMIAELQPEYLLLVAEAPRIAHFYRRPDIYQLYEPIRRFSVVSETNLEPKLEELPRTWRQDYIVYKKRAP